MGLNLFPVRVPIGRATGADGRTVDVLMTVEFARALSDLLTRVGGPNGIGTDELANMVGDQPGYGALIASAINNIAELSARVEQLGALQARIGVLEQALRDLAQLTNMPAATPVDWEHPGKIGAAKANVAYFTKVNNVTIPITAAGSTLSLANGIVFQVKNTLILSGTDGAELKIGGGGQLGTAAFKDGGTTADPWAASTMTVDGGFGCNGKAAQGPKASGGTLAGVISALVANGILAS
jgi:hypothetical protein